MTGKRVFIATASFGEYDAAPLELLKARGLEPSLNPLKRTLTAEEIVKFLDGCVGVVAGTEPYGADVIARLDGTRVISRCGAGLDGIDMAAAGKRGIAVLSTPYGPTQAVAELTLGMILSLIRLVPASTAAIRRGEWKKRMGFLVGELKVGIMGLGKIGKRLAALLRRMDVAVLGCDMNLDMDWVREHGVVILEREELLKQSDVLCLHLPYEKDLRHLIDARAIGLMKPGAFLVNTSRGGLVDERALYDALKSGRLAGAAIDAFEREPYDGPLKELDNVILTPHVGSYARAGRVAMERECVENLLGELQRLRLL